MRLKIWVRFSSSSICWLNTYAIACEISWWIKSRQSFSCTVTVSTTLIRIHPNPNCIKLIQCLFSRLPLMWWNTSFWLVGFKISETLSRALSYLKINILLSVKTPQTLFEYLHSSLHLVFISSVSPLCLPALIQGGRSKTIKLTFMRHLLIFALLI